MARRAKVFVRPAYSLTLFSLLHASVSASCVQPRQVAHEVGVVTFSVVDRVGCCIEFEHS